MLLSNEKTVTPEGTRPGPPEAEAPHEGTDVQEVEWHFATQKLDQVEEWIQANSEAFGFSVDAGTTWVQTDNYYDTEDWAFYRAGYTFRLRRRDRQCEMTFKSLSRPKTLKRRREITQPIDSPDPSLLNRTHGTVANWFVSLAGRRPVRRLFDVHTRRKTLTLRDRNHEVCRIALDHYSYADRQGVLPFEYKVVELEGGEVSNENVRRYVEEMKSKCRLEPPLECSKFEHGLAVAKLEPTSVPVTGPSPSRLSIGDFVIDVLRKNFMVLLKHEPGTRLGEDIEELHQMRVATRRLRAAMGMYRAHLPARAIPLRATLKWIANALGDVRDLDVKLGQLKAWRQSASPADQDAFSIIIAANENKRQQARIRMLRVLNSKRYASFVSNFRKLILQGAPKRKENLAPATDALPALIKPLHKQLIKAGRRIKQEPLPENYHRLRIRCKRLRYGLDFAAEYHGKGGKALRKQLAKLQDLLGNYNDATVARDNIRAILESRTRRLPPRALFMLGTIDERFRCQGEKCLAKFPALYRKLKPHSWKKIQSALLTQP